MESMGDAGDAEYMGYKCGGARTKRTLVINDRTYCHVFLFLAGTSVLADVFPLPQFADGREVWRSRAPGSSVAG
jgi:hypothetical protein